MKKFLIFIGILFGISLICSIPVIIGYVYYTNYAKVSRFDPEITLIEESKDDLANVTKLEVFFAKESDCPDDIIDESKLFTGSRFLGDTPYLMVIDFTFKVKAQGDGQSIMNLSMRNTDASSVDYYVIDAPTSEINETFENDIKTLFLGFKIPDSKGSEKSFRVVIRITPDEEADAQFNVTLSLADKSARLSGKVDLKYDFLATAYGLEYNFYDDYYAVRGCFDDSIEYIEIPSTYKGLPVKEIETYAFRNNKSLKKVLIPDSIEIVEAGVFSECDNLQFNKFENAYYLGNDNNPFYVLVKCANDSITSCHIIESAKIISGAAFSGAKSLSSIVIPNGISTIGEYAFDKCSGISEITIPKNIKSIGIYAFRDCVGLKTVNWLAENCSDCIGNAPLFSGCSSLKTAVIGEGVKHIPAKLFSYCRKITSITIAEGVKSIGDQAFDYCEKITNITIPDSVEEIGVEAFADCSGLKNITIPRNITRISSGAFYNCSGLQTVKICCENAVLSNVFQNCVNLTSVYYDGDISGWCTLTFLDDNSTGLFPAGKLYVLDGSDYKLVTEVIVPDTVTKVSDFAFSRCEDITRVVISNSVTSIGKDAFRFCSSLKDIIIPKSITIINDGVFYGCENLTTVYYKGSEEDWKKISIGVENDILTNVKIIYNS